MIYVVDLNFDWEMLAGASSVIIALCALGLTFWQIRKGNEHNKISVRPNLQINRKEYENNEIGWYFINQGLGPAVITSLSLKIREHVLVDPMTASMTDFLNKHLKLEEIILSMTTDEKCYISVHSRLATSCHQVGEQQLIVVFDGFVDNSKIYDQINSNSKELELEIHYESMYGEKFKVDWNNSSE